MVFIDFSKHVLSCTTKYKSCLFCPFKHDTHDVIGPIVKYLIHSFRQFMVLWLLSMMLLFAYFFLIASCSMSDSIYLGWNLDFFFGAVSMDLKIPKDPLNSPRLRQQLGMLTKGSCTQLPPQRLWHVETSRAGGSIIASTAASWALAQPRLYVVSSL